MSMYTEDFISDNIKLLKGVQVCLEDMKADAEADEMTPQAVYNAIRLSGCISILEEVMHTLKKHEDFLENAIDLYYDHCAVIDMPDQSQGTEEGAPDGTDI